MTIQRRAGRPDSQQYLSLREAAQLYGYTRDHLGLMIRRGKLQGVRLGNYYATMAAWMDEYIRNYSDADNPRSKAKFSNKFRSDILDKKPPQSAPFLPAAANAAKDRQKTETNQKPKNSGLEELQKHIDEVLAQVMPQMVSSPANKTPAPKLAVMPNAAPDFTKLPNALSNHEIIILPVRKMRDFERQIIISQAKQQKHTS